MFETEAKPKLSPGLQSLEQNASLEIPRTHFDERTVDIQTVDGCLFTASDPREEIVSIKHPDAILFTTKLSKDIHQAGKPDRLKLFGRIRAKIEGDRH